MPIWFSVKSILTLRILFLCKPRYFGARLNSDASQSICKILTMVLSHATKNKKHRALITA